MSSSKNTHSASARRTSGGQGVQRCQARSCALREADLALLRVCARRSARPPAFQASLSEDERLLLIARPNGEKSVRRGKFSGPYTFRGKQYWAARIDGHDGFSGSPVYNDRAQIVGVFSGYDWERKLGVISPGERAQKLLEDYNSDKESGGQGDGEQ